MGRLLRGKESLKSVYNIYSFQFVSKLIPNREEEAKCVSSSSLETKDVGCLPRDNFQGVKFFLEASRDAPFKTYFACKSSLASFTVYDLPECSSSETVDHPADMQPSIPSEGTNESAGIFRRSFALVKTVTGLISAVDIFESELSHVTCL